MLKTIFRQKQHIKTKALWEISFLAYLFNSCWRKVITLIHNNVTWFAVDTIIFVLSIINKDKIKDKIMETKTFSVSGMMCEHCKANVERALKAIDGVDNASVSLANKNVTVDYDASLVSTDQMKSAVAESGNYEMSV